ncbi:MAG: hypothetical protein ABL956_04120 [Hyphomonadaceae bacterium]
MPVALRRSGSRILSIMPLKVASQWRANATLNYPPANRNTHNRRLQCMQPWDETFQLSVSIENAIHEPPSDSDNRATIPPSPKR